MSLETLHQAPQTETFTPLSEHQSQTPDSFFAGPPVLHFHSKNTKAVLSEEQLSIWPVLAQSDSHLKTASASGHQHATNGDGEGSPHSDTFIQGLEIWVTSERFIIFRQSILTGISIPYTCISLHAIQRLRVPESQANPEEQPSLYMQITMDSGEDEEENTLELNLIVPEMTTPVEPVGSQTQKLFTAVSECSNLHPDPVNEDEDDPEAVLRTGSEDCTLLNGSLAYGSGIVIPGNNSGDGGLPPPFPGSSGWITAENVNEYFDESGNWREGLGPGAGNVRPRDEVDEGTEERQDVAGEGTNNNGDTKWRRTS